MEKQKLIAFEQALCVLESAGFEGEITFTDQHGDSIEAAILQKNGRSVYRTSRSVCVDHGPVWME